MGPTFVIARLRWAGCGWEGGGCDSQRGGAEILETHAEFCQSEIQRQRAGVRRGGGEIRRREMRSPRFLPVLRASALRTMPHSPGKLLPGTNFHSCAFLHRIAGV